MRSIRLVSLAVLLALAPALRAQENNPSLPFLSPVFGDHMVLQRDKPNVFWGWTRPGEAVRVSIDGRSGSGIAREDGRWEVKLPPPAVGTACEVIVTGASDEVRLRDVLVGDVWLCGGQSNMQWGLPASKDGAAAVSAADHPKIRLFTVAPRPAYGPVAVPRGSWKVCSPESVVRDGGFSAVAYYFARKVQAETGIPIGLVQDCLGGTPVESWMSPAALAEFEEFAQPLAEIDRLRAAGAPEYGNYISHWYDEHDAGTRGGANWADPALDERDWRAVPELAQGFASLGLEQHPAVAWFRREFHLPDPLPAGPAVLHLGVVERMDTAWINGRWVGASAWVENPRAYRIPAGVLKPGRNQITVRVLKLKSKGAFQSEPSKLRLAVGESLSVPLAEHWKAKLSVDVRAPHPLPLGFENWPTMPAVMHLGMIEPVAPLAIAGALWYQGEANASRAAQYRKLLPAMIRDWRAVFRQGDFPFYIVSLPRFQQRRAEPGTDGWTELREAQAFTARNVSNAGLVVTVDTGDANDIHPRDKQPVGERLALLALRDHHGREVVASGPVYRAMTREGGAIRVRFDHVDGGLEVRGESLGEFAVAGLDRKWHWAEARIEGDTVVVSSPAVPEPVAVRYAWQANPLATLYNRAGLPAAPFRTDAW